MVGREPRVEPPRRSLAISGSFLIASKYSCSLACFAFRSASVEQGGLVRRLRSGNPMRLLKGPAQIEGLNSGMSRPADDRHAAPPLSIQASKGTEQALFCNPP